LSVEGELGHVDLASGSERIAAVNDVHKTSTIDHGHHLIVYKQESVRVLVNWFGYLAFNKPEEKYKLI
jgi:hypothetical protein